MRCSSCCRVQTWQTRVQRHLCALECVRCRHVLRRAACHWLGCCQARLQPPGGAHLHCRSHLLLQRPSFCCQAAYACMVTHTDIAVGAMLCRWWIVGGLGARGLVYHAWLGQQLASAVLAADESCLCTELLRWK